MSQVAITWTANGLIIWAALVATLSVVLHARVAWWRSEMGRHLMAYMTVMAAVLILAVVRMFLGDQPWFSLLRLATFIAVPLVMTQRVWLQIKAQRGERGHQAAGDPDPASGRS